MTKPPTGRGPAKPVPGRQAPGRPDQSDRALSTRLRTAKKRTIGSQRWLERQLNDPYVRAARAQGWRSRAAFKLIELDERFHLLRPNLRVVDLGAAPGGWTQVAARRVGDGGRVVALDLLPVEPVPGAILLEGDFQQEATERAVLDALNGQADLVLSDLAPNTTGHNATDHLRIMGLVELAADFARKVLAPGGGFVAKVFQGGAERELLAALKRDFVTVRHAKPPASRKDSAEAYLVAQGFRGAPGGT